MTEAEKQEIVGLVMTEISSQAVDFDITTEQPQANDLLTAVRENESGGYRGVTIKWDDVARIATELANQAATRAEQALSDTTATKTEVGNMKASVEQTVTDFNTLADQKKSEVESVYQTDLNELKGDLYDNSIGLLPIGKIVKNEYIDSTGNFISYPGWGRTDYILIDGMTEILVISGGDSTYNAFYDSDKVFISRLYTYHNEPTIAKVPDNAKYVALSNTISNLNNTIIYSGIGLDVMKLKTTSNSVVNPKLDEDNSILFLNAPDTVGDMLVQAKMPYNDWKNTHIIRPVLQIGVITDVHASITSKNTVLQLKRFIEFCDAYDSYIDDRLCLGDVVLDNYTDDFSYWNNVLGSENIMMTIGNHDAYIGKGDTNLVSKTNLYNRYFAPNIANWNVIQPNGASENGICYYYKDYEDNKVRLIILDCMWWDSEQKTWLDGVLSDAITQGYHVVIGQHYNLTKNMDRINGCNFENKDYLFSELVIGYGSSQALASVDTFISNGGNFVCWISGDTHYDAFGVYNGNHGKQLSLTFENASISDKYNDSARVRGVKSQDSFNMLSIDTNNNLVKVIRIGNDKNRFLQSKKHLCYNYDTHTVVSVG